MVFDSDVLIWFFRGDAGAARLVESEPIRAISIISFMELVQGARSKAEMASIRRFFRAYEFNVIPVSEETSYLAAALIEEHAQSDGLQVADALIAATVRQQGEILSTGNIRHFRAIKGIKVKVFRPATR